MAEAEPRRRPRVGAGVALAVLALGALPTPAALADDFVCRGHDPGWELVGRGGQATLAPDKGATRSFSGGASSLPAEGLVVWRGRAGAGQPDLVAVMLRGACTDPAAGEVSTHLGIVSLPNSGPQVGCCIYGAPPAVAAASAAAAEPELGEGDAEDEVLASPEDERPQQALLAPPSPPPARAAKAAPAAVAKRPPERSLRAGSTVRVAGSSRQSVNLRGRPGEGRVLGQIAGGRSVVVQQSSQRGGQVWYKIRGRGVPSGAWIRGDLLDGG